MKQGVAFIHPKAHTIDKIVCDYFGFTSEEIRLKDRKTELRRARQFVCYFIYIDDDTQFMSLNDIAQFIGFKKHCNVIHSINRVKNDMHTDKYVRIEVKEIELKIMGCAH